MKLNIAIFFGGCSPEYSVSLESASAVISSLDKTKYNPVMIGITREGDWYCYTGDVEAIRKDTWQNEKNCVPAALSPNRSRHELLLFDGPKINRIAIDIAFPVLHGRNGEDGTIQGLIELAGIPLAGCGALASALCMDKDRAHKLVRLAGVRVPEACVLRACTPSDAGFSKTTEPSDAKLNAAELIAAEFTDAEHTEPVCAEGNAVELAAGFPAAELVAAEYRPAQTAPGPETPSAFTAARSVLPAAKQFADRVGYPLFVKPVEAGSSYGITKVPDEAALENALALAFQYDDEITLEETIDGFEVGCALLGRDNPIIGEVDEIELSEGFFDYTEKYTLKSSSIHVPARISNARAAEIKETAKRIYQTLGCSGFARVDMFLTPSGEIVFNEVNTIPGFTGHSRFPGMMKAAGYSFEAILELIIRQTTV